MLSIHFKWITIEEPEDDVYWTVEKSGLLLVKKKVKFNLIPQLQSCSLLNGIPLKFGLRPTEMEYKIPTSRKRLRWEIWMTRGKSFFEIAARSYSYWKPGKSVQRGHEDMLENPVFRLWRVKT